MDEPRAAAGTAHSVCGVLVTFHPEPDALARVIAAAGAQVDELVVVDNSGPGSTVAAGTGVTLLALPANAGLAAAQNVGITHARGRGHSHVLLLDQDSVPEPDMVATLLAAWCRLAATRAVAAVGPRFRDPREPHDAPFVRVAFPMSRKLYCGDGPSEVECDFLISSGSLIPLPVIDAVGGPDDSLFIDNVDLEWSFRARAAGFALFGVCSAAMSHRLGDERRALFGGRYSQVVHSPTRLYYMMRNRVRLYALPHTPRVWIGQDVPRIAVKFLIFAVLVAPRRRNARFMARGLWDGARNRSGRCPIEERAVAS